MKKLLTLLLALAICLSLAACSGVDTQPAVDAFNSASTAFDALANKVNAEPGAYRQDFVDSMVDMSTVLTEYKTMLEGGDSLTEEDVTALVQEFNDIEAWVNDVDANLEIMKAGDLQAAIDAFNNTATVFDEVANAINADPSAFPEDLVTTMSDFADLLGEYKTLLESNDTLDPASVQSIVDWLATVDDMLAGIKTEFGI